VVMSLATLVYLTDRPDEASWLGPGERQWIKGQLEAEKKAKGMARSYSISQVFFNRDVILLTLCYFFAVTGNYGIAFWLPTILKRSSSQSDLAVTLLAALPYLAGFLTQQMNAWHSDRKRERRWHAAVPVILSGVATFLAIKFGSSLLLSVTFFTLVGGAYYAYHPPFWAVPTEFLSGSAAAASIGLINSFGNLGGFVGPMVMGYLASRTQSFHVGLWYLVASFCLSGILMLEVRAGRRPPASGLELLRTPDQ